MTNKLTLTKKQSISECKKLWKGIEESGLLKYEFLNSSSGDKWRAKNYWGHCPLCEYSAQQATKGTTNCSHCPLKIQYGKNCTTLGFDDNNHSTPEWFKAVRGLK